MFIFDCLNGCLVLLFRCWICLPLLVLLMCFMVVVFCLWLIYLLFVYCVCYCQFDLMYCLLAFCLCLRLCWYLLFAIGGFIWL